MRRLNLTVSLLLAASAGACAPNPIVARDPVPAPGPGVAYVCDTRPLVLNAMSSTCEPVERQPQVVLRRKG
ncbi:hypothetical protein ASG40_07125 [Methylobacterium sp. Leaf399]|uniref:hypothetical protein n=1 Tax=Methylobacterium sp. Leaf399 TaxID=1736364 RepID=UPI0006F902C1|nr:hypothetical protein [Methylobacterium sp. Leaf399]KQT11784.1 hypothetical protein ASG40_07125 [Methylobacterium sp. Leaf399]